MSQNGLEAWLSVLSWLRNSELKGLDGNVEIPQNPFLCIADGAIIRRFDSPLIILKSQTSTGKPLMPEYTFVDAQFAFFFNGQLNLRSDELSVEINQCLERIFTAPPLIFPLPDIAPGEIPFLQLKSTNDIYQCNVARTRADFFFHMKIDNNHEDFSIHKESFSRHIDALFTLFSGKIGIQRLGYITKHFIAAPDPSNFIKSKFISREIGSLDELTIRFNKKERKPLFECNNIINLEPAVLRATNVQGVLIQRDINTVKEIDYPFNLELFHAFVQEAESQFGTTIIKGIVD